MNARLWPMMLTWTAICLPGFAQAPPNSQWVTPNENLQAALDQTPPRTTLTLTAGEHHGPIVIRQPITIDAAPGAELVGDGSGIVLTIDADDVHVRNLAISGSGRNLSKDNAGVLVNGDRVELTRLRLSNNLHGIYIRSGKHAQIIDNDIQGLAATEPAPQVIGAEAATREDGVHHSPPSATALMGNGIHLFDADHATVTGNHVHHTRDGIYVAHSSNARFIRNRVRNCRYGIHYMYSHDNVLAENELSNNVAGAALMFSRDLEVRANILRDHAGFRAYGLLLQDVDYTRFTDNQIRGNRVGLRIQNSNANTFRANALVGNITGLRVGSASQDNIFTRNRIGPSLHQVELTGPAPPTAWSVDGVGNHWHDAMPLDLNADGISQWPHHEVDLLAERRERFAPLQLLTASPAVRMIEWALRRAPVPGMRYITDPHPIVGTPHD